MLANDQNVVISNNSKHNNYSNHKPLTGLQYDNNQTAIISYHLLLFCNDNNNFYPQSILIRERKLLLETVTYIAIKESHLHNYNRHGHVHNALQKIPPAYMQQRLPSA